MARLSGPGWFERQEADPELDAAGRTTGITTSAGTTILSYAYEDRVTGIQYPSSATNSFTYNGLDARATKSDSTGSYTYLRDGADVTSNVLSDGTAAYTPGISQRRSSTTTYDLNDYLGSATRQTNTSATTTATRTYDAFGNLEASTGTPLGPFGFVGAAGYQEDHDSGLKLLGHRYYDSTTGRFLTRDSIKNGRNWFAYCSNNPTGAIDPTGNLDDWPKGTTHRTIPGTGVTIHRMPPGDGFPPIIVIIAPPGTTVTVSGGGGSGQGGQGGAGSTQKPVITVSSTGQNGLTGNTYGGSVGITVPVDLGGGGGNKGPSEPPIIIIINQAPVAPTSPPPTPKPPK